MNWKVHITCNLKCIIRGWSRRLGLEAASRHPEASSVSPTPKFATPRSRFGLVGQCFGLGPSLGLKRLLDYIFLDLPAVNGCHLPQCDDWLWLSTLLDKFAPKCQVSIKASVGSLVWCRLMTLQSDYTRAWNRPGRPGGCRTNNLTNKNFYVHIISTFVNVKWTLIVLFVWPLSFSVIHRLFYRR